MPAYTITRRSLLEQATLAISLLASSPLRAATGRSDQAGQAAAAHTTTLDHVLWGAADLTHAMDQFEKLTGVRATIGGQHPGRGTHNALVSLGGRRYLELIAPDPAQKVDNYMVSMVRKLTSPRLVTWAVATNDIEAIEKRLRAAGLRTGAIQDGGRTRPDGQRLSWRTLALNEDETGIVPFVIQWGTNTMHPSQDAPSGCRLRALTLEHPEPDRIAGIIDALNIQLQVISELRDGDVARLRIEMNSPKGVVSLT